MNRAQRGEGEKRDLTNWIGQNSIPIEWRRLRLTGDFEAPCSPAETRTPLCYEKLQGMPSAMSSGRMALAAHFQIGDCNDPWRVIAVKSAFQLRILFFWGTLERGWLFDEK